MLLVGVHAVVVAVLGAFVALAAVGGRRRRRHPGAATPFLIFTQSQLFQVGWISPLGGTDLRRRPRQQCPTTPCPAPSSRLLMVTAAVLQSPA